MWASIEKAVTMQNTLKKLHRISIVIASTSKDLIIAWEGMKFEINFTSCSENGNEMTMTAK